MLPSASHTLGQPAVWQSVWASICMHGGLAERLHGCTVAQLHECCGSFLSTWKSTSTCGRDALLWSRRLNWNLLFCFVVRVCQALLSHHRHHRHHHHDGGSTCTTPAAAAILLWVGIFFFYIFMLRLHASCLLIASRVNCFPAGDLWCAPFPRPVHLRILFTCLNYPLNLAHSHATSPVRHPPSPPAPLHLNKVWAAVVPISK